MREENRNWFANWEEELPSPEELMPLSQTLITPDLALAFDIQNPNHHGTKKSCAISHQLQQSTPPPLPNPPPPPSIVADFGADSSELGSGAVQSGDEPARTLKRPRLVWTPQLHKRFVDAVAHLGIKNAVPKTIMQLMSVEGLTRENVASHLQKYRLYLRRMQGLSGGNGNGNAGIGGGNGGHVSDPATDHLFASSPVPAHFLSPTRVSSEHFMPPLMPVAAQQQIAAAAAAAAAANNHLQPHQYNHQRQAKHFGPPSQNGQFEYPFLGRYTYQQQSQGVHRTGGYVEDLESANGNGGRKVLTLFPTGND